MLTRRTTKRDDSLPHQIRLYRAYKGGGLQVKVGCCCLGVGERIGERNILSLADAWDLYRTHVKEMTNATVVG